MSTALPSADEVRAALKALTIRQLRHLADLSGAAEATLIKIRYGQIENPGLDTVGAFWPHVAAAAAYRGEATTAPVEATP